MAAPVFFLLYQNENKRQPGLCHGALLLPSCVAASCAISPGLLVVSWHQNEQLRGAAMLRIVRVLVFVLSFFLK